MIKGIPHASAQYSKVCHLTFPHAAIGTRGTLWGEATRRQWARRGEMHSSQGEAAGIWSPLQRTTRCGERAKKNEAFQQL